MKAVRIHAHGGLEQLRYEEIDDPKVDPFTVLVRVKACALNHLDIWVRQGLPGVKVPLPLILGSDMSGTIADIGSGVTTLHTGDEVVVSPGLSCGLCEHCLTGNDHFCRHYQILGEHCNGGYAQYIAIPVQNILPKPKNLNFEEAASFPLVFLTAWHMLVTLAKVSPGKLVLIHAAGSGIGSAAIQISKLFGATVFATASSEEKLAKAQALGADYLINYHQDDFQNRVKELTRKTGVDIVFEHTGEKTFEGSYLSLCKGGTLVTCGASSGYHAKIDLRYLFSRQLKILGSTMGSKGELAQIMHLVGAGKLKPVVDRSFPLSEARNAQIYLEERKQFGKILVIP